MKKITLTVCPLLSIVTSPSRSRSKEKDSVDPLSEKKKIKEEKEDEKVEDVSTACSVLADLPERRRRSLFLISPLVSGQQDFDQNKLEEEMRKRKERVEKWREEQRKKAIENIGEIKRELEDMKQGKKWSLEDDEGEEEEEDDGVIT